MKFQQYIRTYHLLSIFLSHRLRRSHIKINPRKGRVKLKSSYDIEINLHPALLHKARKFRFLFSFKVYLNADGRPYINALSGFHTHIVITLSWPDYNVS